jgi:hypothetical protein
MARQRNNVARLPADVRREVCRLLFDGQTYADVRRAMPSGAPVLHNNSLLAFQKSSEYRQYCERRGQFEQEIGADRLIAEAINDGRGPETLTDLVVFDVVRQLRGMSNSDDPATLANITRCLAPILRQQQANAKLAQDTRLADAERRHEAEAAELKAKVAALAADNRRMKDAIERAGINLESGRQTVDLGAVSEQMDELLGGG